MVVADVDMPDVGLVPVPCAGFNPTVARAFAAPEQYMFLPNFKSISQRPGPSMRAYEDPILDDPLQRRGLALRMWCSGMLTTVEESLATVSLFTVAKKVRDDGSVELRLVFDLRVINQLFMDPPWAALGGPAAVPRHRRSHRRRRRAARTAAPRQRRRTVS